MIEGSSERYRQARMARLSSRERMGMVSPRRAAAAQIQRPLADGEHPWNASLPGCAWSPDGLASSDSIRLPAGVSRGLSCLMVARTVIGSGFNVQGVQGSVQGSGCRVRDPSGAGRQLDERLRPAHVPPPRGPGRDYATWCPSTACDLNRRRAACCPSSKSE
jgi:hypothetical protein